MNGFEINKRGLAIFMSAILLYDCIFDSLMHDSEYRYRVSLFPPKFYHAVVSQSTETKNPCAALHTCKVQQKRSFASCYCDSACKIYRDCCFDAVVNNTSKSFMVTSNQAKIQYSTCETKIIRGAKHYGIWMISSCPFKHVSSDISDKCKLEENTLPVSANDGSIFKNVYCAICHNVRQYKVWQFEYVNEGKCLPAYMELLNASIPYKIRYVIKSNCQYRFVPPANAKIRACPNNAINEATDSTLCSRFQSPVLTDEMVYRNIFCYSKSLNIKEQICASVSDEYVYWKRGYASISLTSIFNIRPVIEMFGQKTCEEKFYYDTTKDACVPNSCKKEQEDNCKAELIRNFKNKLILIFVTDNLVDRSFFLRLTSFLYLSLPRDRYETSLDDMVVVYKCGRNITSKEKSCCVSNAKIYLTNKAQMTSLETKNLKSDIENMRWTYIEKENKNKFSAFDLRKHGNLNESCNVTGISKTKFQGSGGELRSVMSGFAFHAKKSFSEVPSNVEGVIVISKRRNSSKSELRMEEWNVEFASKNEVNKTVLNISSEYNANLDWSIGTILTYGTLGMSCCFLFLTLSIYSYFGLFRSHAGVLSKYMMVTMLAAQVLFIVGIGANYDKNLCTVIGIVSHYLWLTSFTWVSLFLLSILKMMRSLYTCPGDLARDKKVSKKVYCLGFVVPFIFVVPCALFEILTDVNIGYSDGNICFPTGLMANLFSFTLPVVISLCINVFSLNIFTVLISRHNDTVLNLQPVRQNRAYIPVYIKLSIICAFPWFLGIIADIANLNFLRYIFVLLAGSHGTFVGLTFLLAKSVRRRIGCFRHSIDT